MIFEIIITVIVVIGLIAGAVIGLMDDPLARFKGVADKTPQEHLYYLVQYMRGQGFTPEQLAQAWDMPAPIKAKESQNNILAKVMYFLGSVLVFAGIGIYISMFWDSMSSSMRIFVTLGTGMGMSVLSAIAMKEGKYPKAILPLVIVAALVQCGGWFVFLHEMFPHGDDPQKAALFCFGMMAFQQAMVFQAFRTNILAFTAIAFSYGALQAALNVGGMKEEHIALLLGGCMIYTAYILERTPHTRLSGFFYAFGAAWFNTGVFATIETPMHWEWASMATGISVCSFGAAMRHIGKDKMAGLALFIGSGLFYSGLFEEVEHTPLELGYFIVAIAMMYVSALVQSRALLATSVLAILGFIGYYTSEHFINSAGWPIALMLMGIAFLGVGTMAVRIKRRYNM